MLGSRFSNDDITFFWCCSKSQTPYAFKCSKCASLTIFHSLTHFFNHFFVTYLILSHSGQNISIQKKNQYIGPSYSSYENRPKMNHNNTFWKKEKHQVLFYLNKLKRIKRKTLTQQRKQHRIFDFDYLKISHTSSAYTIVVIKSLSYL